MSGVNLCREKLPSRPKNRPFDRENPTFRMCGLKKNKKILLGGCGKKGALFVRTPPPPFLVFLGLQKTCNGAGVKWLHMQYVHIVNVQRFKKRVQSGSEQSTGINPGRVKVGINFAPQSSFANKPICFIN